MRTASVLACVLATAACGGNAKRDPAAPAPEPLSNKASASEPTATPASASMGPPASAAEALAMMRVFEARFCACADAPCVERASDDMTKWAQQVTSNQAMPRLMTDEQQKLASEIGMRMATCMQRAMGAGLSSPSQPTPP